MGYICVHVCFVHVDHWGKVHCYAQLTGCGNLGLIHLPAVSLGRV